MKHKIIQTENYLLVVDDSEIKVRDFCYNSIKNTWNEDIILYQDAMPKYHYVGFKKIIAHLPLNNSPILEGVDLLPPIEDDEVEKLAVNNANDFYEKYRTEWEAKKNGFIDGYNKAKEKYKYTKEDLRNAIVKGFLMGMDREHNITEVIEQIIQSLQQPKIPVGFECEMEEITIGGFVDGIDEAITIGKKNVPKTTTNSQGLTQWVGKYIYD